MFFKVAVLAFIGLVAAQDPDCGKRGGEELKRWDKMIVGGRDAASAAWPWQVSLQYRASDGSFRHTCGGVLISPNFVLTAAHCTDGRGSKEMFRVAAGLNNIEEETGTVFEVEEIINHEDFEMNPIFGFPNDIGLLKLKTPVETNDKIQFACLPPKDVDFAGNSDCWISGWGKTWFTDEGVPAKLQEANVAVPTTEQCQEEHIGTVLDTHICAGDGYPSACSGDSGGPMSCKVDGVWHVAGVTSWGIATCVGLPSVYTRITSYLDWLEGKMELYA